jgi:hypothetical protein
MTLLDRACPIEGKIAQKVNEAITEAEVEHAQSQARNTGDFGRAGWAKEGWSTGADAGNATVLAIRKNREKAARIIHKPSSSPPKVLVRLCGQLLVSQPPLRRLTEPGFAKMVLDADRAYAESLVRSIARDLRDELFGATDLKALRETLGERAYRILQKEAPQVELLEAAERFADTPESALITSVLQGAPNVLSDLTMMLVGTMVDFLANRARSELMAWLSERFRRRICDQAFGKRWYVASCALASSPTLTVGPGSDAFAVALRRDLDALPAVAGGVIAQKELKNADVIAAIPEPLERKVTNALRSIRSGAVDLGMESLAEALDTVEASTVARAMACGARLSTRLDSLVSSDFDTVRRGVLGRSASIESCRQLFQVRSQPRDHFSTNPTSNAVEPLTVLTKIDTQVGQVDSAFVSALTEVRRLRATLPQTASSSAAVVRAFAVARFELASQAVGLLSPRDQAQPRNLISTFARLAQANTPAECVATTAGEVMSVEWDTNNQPAVDLPAVIEQAGGLVRLSEAKTEEEVEDAIEELSLPAGGWRNKARPGVYTASFGVLLGVHGGGEMRSGQRGATLESKRITGAFPSVFAPLIVEFSEGQIHNTSLGGFVSLIDPGAYLQYDNEGRLPAPNLLTSLSPGVGFRASVPYSMLNGGLLLSWRPFLRSSEDGIVAPTVSTFQATLFLAADITLWTFFQSL